MCACVHRRWSQALILSVVFMTFDSDQRHSTDDTCHQTTVGELIMVCQFSLSVLWGWV